MFLRIIQSCYMYQQFTFVLDTDLIQILSIIDMD